MFKDGYKIETGSFEKKEEAELNLSKVQELLR
jgi:hypothetical protein